MLQVHGGPHAQYGEVYFHEMQVLAAAGYIVFMSNPRGKFAHSEAPNWMKLDMVFPGADSFRHHRIG